jgi:D-tyrosyl-tRNA(Tyr) deacylase
MIGLIQRVREAEVSIEGRRISAIGKGILLLAGIAGDDGPDDASYLARKTVNLRLFADDAGNLNRSLIEEGGSALVVSQFTLLGDTRKGRRPSFTDAAPPESADRLYRMLIDEIRAFRVDVQEGRFGAMMDVSLVNSGPVTLIVNSRSKTILH